MNGIEYLSKKNNKNLIIFVHGFTGSKDTWKNKNGKYFPDMLLENVDILNNFDVAYFNYYSKFMEIFTGRISNLGLKRIFLKKGDKNRKNIDIYSLADFMKSTIRYNCESYDNIVIIAHSMGGLIAKSYIIKEIQDFSETKVGLFISLAVPHMGTNLANLAKVINNRNIQINNLEPLNNVITELNRNWVKVDHPKTIYFVGQYDNVVEKTSAISIDKIEEDIIQCDDDHLSISKPSSKEELNYIAIEKELLEFKNNVGKKEDIIVKKFNDDGRYDNDLFVIKLIVADIDKTLVNGAKSNFFNAEYLCKILNTAQLNSLEELYVKIKDLYVLYYGKYVSDEIKSGNELLTNINKAIREDDKLNIICKKYKELFSLITSIHKTGMLHQMADQENEDIYWKKDCTEDIKKIMNLGEDL